MQRLINRIVDKYLEDIEYEGFFAATIRWSMLGVMLIGLVILMVQALLGGS